MCGRCGDFLLMRYERMCWPEWPGRTKLPRFVELEYAPCLFEVEDVSIDDELIFACVLRYMVNAFYYVAAFAKLLD